MDHDSSPASDIPTDLAATLEDQDAEVLQAVAAYSEDLSEPQDGAGDTNDGGGHGVDGQIPDDVPSWCFHF